MSVYPLGRLLECDERPLTVLIVDDSPEDAGAMIRFLSGAGQKIQCHHAQLGEDGAALLSRVQPDCVLLDFNLPDMTGLEFIRQFQPQVPVLVITGSAEHTVAASVLQAGATRLLYKGELSAPFLNEQITKGLQEHQLKRQLRLERRRMQAVLDSTGNGMLFIRRYGQEWAVEFLNPAARMLLGLSSGVIAPSYEPLLSLLDQCDDLCVALDCAVDFGGRALTLDCMPGADGFTVTVRDASAERRRMRLDHARHEVLLRFAESRTASDVLLGLQDLIQATLPGLSGHVLTGSTLDEWPHLTAMRRGTAQERGGSVQSSYLPGVDGGCWALPVLAPDEDRLLGLVVVRGAGADTDVPHLLADIVNLTSLLLTQTRDQDRLRFQAWRDPLTSLPNRAVFMDQLQRELHSVSRNHTSLAVGILDLDGFKGVNDTYGHACGDALLVEVARRLRLAFRASDLVARVGGDEFTLLLTDWVNLETLEAELHRRLEQVMEPPFMIPGADVQVRASLGIALAPLHAQSADALLQLADRAMYRAKRAGGGLHLNVDALPQVN